MNLANTNIEILFYLLVSLGCIAAFAIAELARKRLPYHAEL